MPDFFEEIIYTEEDVITFEKGLPGFEKHKEFILLKIPEHEPFEWLVCTDTSKLRFALINPLLFKPDYNPKIDKSQIESLQLEKPEDILIYAIVTLSPNIAESTANLMGPIIINRTKRLGKQIILDDETHSVKERILK